jgi:hypothetical protein
MISTFQSWTSCVCCQPCDSVPLKLNKYFFCEDLLSIICERERERERERENNQCFKDTAEDNIIIYDPLNVEKIPAKKNHSLFPIYLLLFFN